MYFGLHVQRTLAAVSSFDVETSLIPFILTIAIGCFRARAIADREIENDERQK